MRRNSFGLALSTLLLALCFSRPGAAAQTSPESAIYQRTNPAYESSRADAILAWLCAS